MTGLVPSFRLPPDVLDADSPIGSPDDLVGYFEAGCKTPDQRLVGVEYERLALLADGSAAPYAGPEKSVESVLRFIADACGAEPQIEDGHLLGLLDSEGAVHLEPGAQCEFAIAPHVQVSRVLASLRSWRDLLLEAAPSTGVSVTPLGLQPITATGDIGWVPKDRYQIMSAHLGARGKLAHDMMKASAGLQLNVDYTSEEDAAELMSTSLAISPIVNALCVNSPITEGKPNGFLSRRPEIWLNTDPDRTGLIPWVLEAGFSFERYVEYALGVPVLFIVRDGVWSNLGDKTFGELLDDPGDLAPINFADWHLHLTTLFPEVRIKQHVEIRGMDSCGVDLAAAIAGVWRGLLYDEGSRREARGLVADLDTSARLQLHLGVGREGLACRVGQTRVGELAQDLVRMARAGLERLDADTAHDDAALLAPLEPILETGRSPAHDVLDAFARKGLASLTERA